MTKEKPIQVAVGILTLDEKFLLSLRSPNVVQGNRWEFPGGKVENNESSYQALCRELLEELNIEVIEAQPMEDFVYQYSKYSVQIFPWMIVAYNGKPQSNEDQQLCWMTLGEIKKVDIPDANFHIIKLLQNKTKL